jgi:hypothetical protein
MHLPSHAAQNDISLVSEQGAGEPVMYTAAGQQQRACFVCSVDSISC